MSKMVYPADSKELQGVLHHVEAVIVKQLEGKQVRVLDTLDMPKRWGGYEIPLALRELSSVGFKQCYANFISIFTEDDYFRLAQHAIRDARKQSTIVIGAVLISRCKKSKRPGLLIYWNR